MIKFSKCKNSARLIAALSAFSLLVACGEYDDYSMDYPPYAYQKQSAGAMTCSASAAQSLSMSANASASASAPSTYGINYVPGYGLDEDFNTEEYSALGENVFKDVATSPLSTFSADVDTASYANVRRLLNEGVYPLSLPEGSIRVEEMVNYFSYNYSEPSGESPFGICAEISDCPWNASNKLLRLGIKTEDIDYSESADSNIVLLIDVSGSMKSPNKLPMVVDSFAMMLDNLTDKDRVSIVTYANGVNVLLIGEKGSHKDEILKVLQSLDPHGGTCGEGGIEAAYELAEKNFIKGGNNRIIIASDGDFNIGKSSESELSELIQDKASKGIFLTVLGYGDCNYSDVVMETLADDGNGNYAYIDSLKEAEKVLVDEFGANMVTVAKDVKFQAEFNPVYVSEYRLIGYENRALNNEDFDNDKKDAGEIGAGHSVTILYEIVPADPDSSAERTLKYQTSSPTDAAVDSDEWLTLCVRYKEPNGIRSKKLEYTIGSNCVNDTPSEDFLFAASVAEYAMILRRSEFVGDGSIKHICETLSNLNLNDEYKQEFSDIVNNTYIP